MAKADRARANGLKALKTVEDVLTDIGWDPQPTETEGMLRIDFSSDDIPIAEALASVRIDFERFVFYLIVRDRAPAKHRAQVRLSAAQPCQAAYYLAFDQRLQRLADEGRAFRYAVQRPGAGEQAVIHGDRGAHRRLRPVGMN